LSEFGIDSPEYAEAVGKLRVLEALVAQLERSARDITIKPTIDLTDAGSVDLTGFEVIANVLEAPLAAVRFLIHQLASDASDDFQAFRSDYSGFVNDVALGANSVTAAMQVQADAVDIFGDSLKAM